MTKPDRRLSHGLLFMVIRCSLVLVECWRKNHLSTAEIATSLYPVDKLLFTITKKGAEKKTKKLSQSLGLELHMSLDKLKLT